MVFPRSGGTRLTGRERTSRIASVVSRTCSISSEEKSSRSSTSLRSIRTLLTPHAQTPPDHRQHGDIGSLDQHDLVDAIRFGKAHLDLLVDCRRDILSNVICPYRQLAVTAVDQNGKLHVARSPVVHHGAESGPRRPPGEHHVVDNDDTPI